MIVTESSWKPDDRAACCLVREWSGAWRTTVVSRRTPELHDVIAGAACVVSSRLHPALLAVASGVPVIALSGHPKVVETLASMGRGQCVIDPAGASAGQVTRAAHGGQAASATLEVEEALLSTDAVLAEVLR